MTPLLDLQGVSKSFPVRKTGLFGRRRNEVTALDQITLDVYKGETVSIVGESGCGKSTLARTAGMLLAPDSGTVKLNGRDVYGLRARKTGAPQANSFGLSGSIAHTKPTAQCRRDCR